ncbi:uncharacterized protein ATNIH1004_004889 [Aspergillus tanneri]|nr:uncharacterized protein ATNIH1004_004889 [Aspergillus tanneri]KAA8648999.1 hypothetical protein ATNIH1004_004889 [Aspergillus tanneri]
MLGSWDAARPTTVWAVALLLFGFGQLTPVVALRTTHGSPCVDECNQRSNSTTGSDIVCLDGDFSDTARGSKFQSCVECQLRSNYSDEASGQTDVDWGLYNLRYAFTTCVYGFPENINNMSSQCTVNCQSLDLAVEYDLKNPSGNNFDSWCGSTAFADNVISDCESCYNLTSGQIYMANWSNVAYVVLEALRYNCHFPVPSGKEFPINPTRIFSQSLLPESTVDLINPSGTSGSGVKNLALVIALPILGFIILVCTLAVGCFFFIRSRRRKARRERASGHLHARWNDTTISTPGQGNWGQYHDMYSPGTQHGYGAGFNFVDSDGREQQTVGFSKSHYASASESSMQAPSTTYSVEKEKGVEPQHYSGAPPSQKQ